MHMGLIQFYLNINQVKYHIPKFKSIPFLSLMYSRTCLVQCTPELPSMSYEKDGNSFGTTKTNIEKGHVLLAKYCYG